MDNQTWYKNSVDRGGGGDRPAVDDDGSSLAGIEVAAGDRGSTVEDQHLAQVRVSPAKTDLYPRSILKYFSSISLTLPEDGNNLETMVDMARWKERGGKDVAQCVGAMVGLVTDFSVSGASHAAEDRT